MRHPGTTSELAKAFIGVDNTSITPPLSIAEAQLPYNLSHVWAYLISNCTKDTEMGGLGALKSLTGSLVKKTQAAYRKATE